ncbi:hypothetical protein ACLM5J_16445 [Nocardioides sp. Bht2]|uniref:hypothetical protein n=1 Tax=Nocardioides sp. Bht2 TaxID=3392297 RepID=UPI0039B691F7
MTVLLILLATLSLLSLAALPRAVANDGHRSRGARPAPRSHHADPFEARGRLS